MLRYLRARIAGDLPKNLRAGTTCKTPEKLTVFWASTTPDAPECTLGTSVRRCGSRSPLSVASRIGSCICMCAQLLHKSCLRFVELCRRVLSCRGVERRTTCFLMCQNRHGAIEITRSGSLGRSTVWSVGIRGPRVARDRTNRQRCKPLGTRVHVVVHVAGLNCRGVKFRRCGETAPSHAPFAMYISGQGSPCARPCVGVELQG